jgi:hypothetical protein
VARRLTNEHRDELGISAEAVPTERDAEIEVV